MTTRNIGTGREYRRASFYEGQSWIGAMVVRYKKHKSLQVLTVALAVVAGSVLVTLPRKRGRRS